MYLLIIYMILFIIIALMMLSLPFIRNGHSLLSKPFIIISNFIIIIPIILYLSFGQLNALSGWLSYGKKQHYELAVKVQELGGIEGLIVLLKQRLKEHPGDKKASELLHKLMAMKNNS